MTLSIGWGWLRRVWLALVGLAFAFPFGYLALGTLTLDQGLLETLSAAAPWRPLANSLVLAVTVAVACAVLGTTLAFFVSSTTLVGRRVWRVVLPLPLVVPSFVGATAVLAATGPGSLLPFVPRPSGFVGSFIVLTLLCYPYVLLPVMAALGSTSRSLEETSRLLGRGSFVTTVRVVLPQVREAILGGGLLVSLYVLSDFGAVSLLRFDTITRAIYSSRLLDRPTSLTLGSLLALLALLIVVLMRAASRSTPAHPGPPPVRHALGWWQVPALGLAALVVGAALIVPVVVFAGWVIRGSTTIGIGYSGLGDDLGFLAEPLWGSTVSALAAALVAMLVLLPVAFAAARRPSRFGAVVTTIVTSVFALPGLVVALALVFWAVNAPPSFAGLYQSFPLLVLAYVLHFGAQSLRSSEAAIAAVPPRLEEAARTLGAGAARRFLSVDLPLVLPGVLAGGGLVLLSVLKELPATLLLAPIGFETLAMQIWGAAQEGFYAEVGVASLVLILLSGALTWPLVLRPQLFEGKKWGSVAVISPVDDEAAAADTPHGDEAGRPR